MNIHSRWPVIVALALASSINFLDRAALGVVAPQIQAEFHLDAHGYQAIINAFCSPLPSPTPLAGRWWIASALTKD